MAVKTFGVSGESKVIRLINWMRTPPVTRLKVERREAMFLSRYAFKSESSRGRSIEEVLCDYRPPFARDRDRIIHSKAFRRLQNVTQVLSPEALPLPESQYIHTRLFHLLKVAQIARDICRALGLNEDLAEAIALGHDLGHPPFGHEGEKVLNELSMKYLGKPFKHNRQSLRVVDELEGLNLSFEVRDGILRHDGEKKDPILRPYQQPLDDLTLDDREFPTTLEGCVVRLADRIAYLPVDREDGLMLRIIRRNQIPKIVEQILGHNTSEMIDTLIRDVIASSSGRNYITMSPKVREALDALYEFNLKHICSAELATGLIPKIGKCLRTLYKYYTQEAGKTPQEAIDMIASLTDLQAIALFEEIAVIKPHI